MPKLPDLSGYSLEDLSRLIAAANRRADEMRGKRIKELQAELYKLGGGEGGAAARGRAGRKPRQQPTAEGEVSRKRGAGSARKVAVQFRGPNGEEYSGRGAIPKWARDLGVSERSGLERFRVANK